MDAKASGTILIGSDHGGYELKRKILAYLDERGQSPTRISGSDSGEIVRYPHYAVRVAKGVSRQQAQRGILICSTGIGMSIIANKFRGRTRLAMHQHLYGQADAGTQQLECALPGRQDHRRAGSPWTSCKPGWIPITMAGRHDISLGLIADAEEQLSQDERLGTARANSIMTRRGS